METGLIVGLVLAIPIIFFPAAYVWYLNIGGIVAIAREKRAAKRRLAEGPVVVG